MAGERDNRECFRIQAGYCAAMAAPITARVCVALATALDRESDTARRALDWPGEPIADALALRLVGGLHALARSGADPALARVFAGEVTDAAAVQATLAAALRDHDAALFPWLDGPPQTNEGGRSAGLMTGLLHLAARFGPKTGGRVELLEIGSSAGMTLLIDRYAFDLGGVLKGPPDSPVLIRPDWRGPPPPDVPIEIVSVRGVDVAPLDATDPAQAARLAAYVWADAPERMARIERGTRMIRERPVRLERGDAADWVEARLAEPQDAGVTRVLLHSVVWQYLGDARRERIRLAMDAAGARARPDRPVAWVMMEPDRDLHRHDVRVQAWPGGAMELVALTHAHGAWVEALEPPYATRDYVMRRGPYEGAGRRL